MDVTALRGIGRSLTSQLSRSDVDAIVTNDYSIAAVAPNGIRLILFTDSILPHDYRLNTHPWLANMSRYGVWSEKRIISKALRRAASVAFASRFAREEALKYGISGEKAHVIPYGANLEKPPEPSVASARRFTNVQRKGRLDCLFVGKSWLLKGGQTAIDIVTELRSSCVDARLHIVGCEPPNVVELDYISVYGFLHKSSAHDRSVLDRLYRECDLLVLPTAAEGFGVVFAEAAAYGMPSISYDTTGVSTAVCNGESGVLLPQGSTSAAFSSVVLGWYKQPHVYDSLCVGARRRFEEVTNWEQAARSLSSLIESEREPVQ
jgi:glycosyltransferase involved in cell wall biosynthesis